MITKDQINAANKRVKDVDAKLGKLTGQILEARGKALECKRKAEAKKAELPIDASIEQHQAAAREAAAEFTKHDGERKYWAELHERLTKELATTRMEAAQAEATCVQLAQQFWEGRFEEQTRAFFERNFDALKDLLGTIVRMSHGNMPRLFEFWQMLTAKFPGDLEQMRSGVVASERVLPPPAIALNLRTEDREAATGVAQGSDHDGRRSRQLSAVGPDCSAESVDNIRGREASTRRGISHHEARIYNERRELESLRGQLSRDGHKKDKAKELSDKIAAAESTIANAEAAIKTHEATLAECAAQLAAIETERAKLEAVKVG